MYKPNKPLPNEEIWVIIILVGLAIAMFGWQLHIAGHG